MESTDLKSPTPDDALEAWLRTNSAQSVLPDDGFSQRVIAALPVRSSPRFSRTFFGLGGLAAGIVIVLVGVIGSGGLPANLPALDTQLTQAVGQLLAPPALLALVLALLSVGYAFRNQLRLLPRL